MLKVAGRTRQAGNCPIQAYLESGDYTQWGAILNRVRRVIYRTCVQVFRFLANERLSNLALPNLSAFLQPIVLHVLTVQLVSIYRLIITDTYYIEWLDFIHRQLFTSNMIGVGRTNDQHDWLGKWGVCN